MQKGARLGFNSKQALFKGYVELMQKLLKLTKSEASVFAQLLFLNNEKKDIPETDRFNIIFSTSSRKDISKELGMSDQVLQNCFTKLRKKKLIVNNSIPKNRQVFIENELLVVLKLELKDV